MTTQLESAIRALRDTVEANEARRRGAVFGYETRTVLDELESRDVLAALDRLTDINAGVQPDCRPCSACRQMGYHKDPFSSSAGLCIDCLQSELDAMMCPSCELRLPLTPPGGLTIEPGKTIELLKRDFQVPVRLRRFVSSQTCSGGTIVEDMSYRGPRTGWEKGEDR